MAIGRRPGRGAAGPTPGPPSEGARSRGLCPLQLTACSRERRLRQRGPGQAGPGPTAGVGRRQVAPRVPHAPVPSLPARSPRPRLPIGCQATACPALARSPVAGSGSAPSRSWTQGLGSWRPSLTTRGLRRSRVEGRGWPSPSCTRTPAELHLRGDRFVLPKCRRTLDAPGEHWTGSLWTCVELWLTPLLLCDLERDVPLPGLGFLFRWALLRGLLVNYTHPGLEMG